MVSLSLRGFPRESLEAGWHSLCNSCCVRHLWAIAILAVTLAKQFLAMPFNWTCFEWSQVPMSAVSH